MKICKISQYDWESEDLASAIYRQIRTSNNAGQDDRDMTQKRKRTNSGGVCEQTLQRKTAFQKII